MVQWGVRLEIVHDGKRKTDVTAVSSSSGSDRLGTPIVRARKHATKEVYHAGSTLPRNFFSAEKNGAALTQNGRKFFSR